MSRRVADLVAGAVLAVLGAVLAVAAWGVTTPVEDRLHPKTLPLLTAAVVAVAGLVLAVGAARRRGPDLPVDWPDRAGARRVGWVMASLVGGLLLVPRLGFPAVAMGLVAGLSWALGRYHPLVAGGLGLATAVVVYEVFMQFLGLTLPAGPLGP